MNALYKEPITLCDAQSCIQLVELADEYDALVAVSPIIQIAILEWNEWVEALVCLPLEFLTLANKLESKILFKEALIHAVGRLVEDSETFSGCEKGLPIETRCLLTDEIVALQRRIQRITYELLSLQVLEPSSRWDNETRLTAMMFWATLGGIIREAESGTTNHARLFRKIHNHRFLTDSQLMNNSNQFSRPKIQSCFDIMVPAVKSRVSEFTKDCTTFTVGQELDYLTCIEVSDDKLPWMKVNSTQHLIASY